MVGKILASSDMSQQVLVVKGVAVALGVVILVVAAILGFISISDEQGMTGLENAMDDFLQGLSTYEKINAYQEPLVNHFDVVKLKGLTGEQIQQDLDPGYDFIVEILDVSQYSDRYSFSEEDQTAFKLETQGTYDSTLTEFSVATLVVGQENHAALLKVTLRT
jgi:hypothetical protein